MKSGNCIEYNVNSNDKDPKFQVGDNVRISKYKNIFTKGYTPNLSEKVFVVTKVKNTVGHMLLVILMVKILLEHFMRKNCRKQIKKNLGDKLYVKWKGYDNLFNSWIDKKDFA